MIMQDGQSILFTGDSITDCGRARPLGQGPGLGDGYVALIDSLLAASHPERRIRVLNTGIGGNRVTDLETRWRGDVAAHHPDWLSVMIGINDVWRQFDNAADPNQVTVDRYEMVYRSLLEQIRPSVFGLVLMTPYVIEPDTTEPMRKRMDLYSEVVKRLADDYSAVFVDVQAAFDRYLVHRSAKSLADDRIHPNRTGHMIIATAFLTAVGFD
ncbi:MAG: SGNH/GDSL hydrolase family protein [Kiritimatiellia bacterium]